MITVLGSINLDMIAGAEHLPRPGETVPGTGFATAPGGKGANQALAARRAGAEVRMAGAVGNDAFAAEALAELAASGVDLGLVAQVEGPTGVALILVDGEGENVIVVVPGANGEITAETARELVSAMGPGDMLMLQQEIPPASIRAALETAAEREVLSMLNIAPVTRDSRDLVQLASIVVANLTEFCQLAGFEVPQSDIEQMAGEWARTHDKALVITLGRDGVVGATPEESLHVPAFEIEPVDTVGAGDTFCGYLAASLTAGMPFHDALQRAAVAGSLACLKPGAQPAIPHASDVDEAMSSGSS